MSCEVFYTLNMIIQASSHNYRNNIEEEVQFLMINDANGISKAAHKKELQPLLC